MQVVSIIILLIRYSCINMVLHKLYYLYFLSAICCFSVGYAHASNTAEIYEEAVTYREQGNYQQAIDALNRFLNTDSKFNDEIEFELGLNYFLWKKTNESQRHLQKVVNDSTKEPLRNLATLYLARIAIREGHLPEAATILNTLANRLPKDHLLGYELAFLRGEVNFQLHNYSKAAEFFEQALPKRNHRLAEWYHETLYHLGWSYLKLGDDPTLESNVQRHYFDKAEDTFKTLLAVSPSEDVYLALGQCYLTKASRLKDDEAHKEADALLSMTDKFVSREAQTLALLLRAEASPSDVERDKFYRELTQEQNKDSPHYAKGVYYRALSHYNQKSHEGFVAALGVLEPINGVQSEDIYYLRGLIATLVGKDGQLALRQGLEEYPRGQYADASWNLLGIIAFEKEDYKGAEEAFATLVAEFPDSPLAGEGIFWCAVCAEKMNRDSEIIRAYRKKAFENYPQSPYAAEAYFRYHSYNEYLQGDRAAIKHLQAFAQRFPNSPYLINAYYLMGLDYKRDRKTPEGKWIARRNLTAAIEAFRQVEDQFDQLNHKGLLPADQLEYFTNVKYRSHLERALGNLAIAEESQGAKKRIYLDYAEEEFSRIVQALNHSQHSSALAIQEESSFWLARTYIKNNDENAAEKVLSGMLEKYRSAKITRGYFLSRVWYELGMIDMRREKYENALENFARSEDAAKGKLLSTDQKLDLWIQQSLCYKALNQTDKAMLVLSKVINDDAVSGLRLKAMYLRADIYEQQGRPELARKQLEATSKKGGEWALKAKKKLEENYGYQ